MELSFVADRTLHLLLLVRRRRINLYRWPLLALRQILWRGRSLVRELIVQVVLLLFDVGPALPSKLGEGGLLPVSCNQASLF